MSNVQVRNSGSGFDADRPVEDVKTLKAMLRQFESKIMEVVPAFFNGKRLIQLVLVAANKNDLILKCTAESVIQSVMTSAELGLDISGSMGEAYLVPYWTNKKKRYECQLIPGYRGLVKLALRGGEVRRVDAAVVFEEDFFEYEEGTSQRLLHRPTLSGDRGKAIGVYALAELSGGGIQIKYLRREDVEKVREISQMKDSGPWKVWEDEMWMKTAFRNLSKWLPLSSESFAKAIDVSDREFVLSKARTKVQDAVGFNAKIGLPAASELIEEEDAGTFEPAERIGEE